MAELSAERRVICPFCGLDFEPEDALCEHGCPLHAVCNLIRCPGCDYEFPERPKAVGWLASLLDRIRRPRLAPCEAFRPLTSLPAGTSARLVSLAGDGRRRNTLAVFGLVPGSELTLLQSRPTYVIQVGETQLALESDVAAELYVESLRKR